MKNWLCLLTLPVWCCSCATPPDTAYLKDPLLQPAPVVVAAPAPVVPPPAPITRVYYPPLVVPAQPLPATTPATPAVAANVAENNTPADQTQPKARRTGRRYRPVYYGNAARQAAAPAPTTNLTPKKNAKPRSI